ncbi:hypothetical protein RD110_15550 [Rhodoferax koreense]|uniref:Peptidase S74 domain-containing protein n=1 Tax=Rhodoferax koreensis TaxID=1842727 RepID=A0A1P8JXF2_9BURK|nr:tail fiber domain-containing protein [Rhodoferax koreense]APW38437.1 hypothetical protein RD110_15550 [Rhodoferax koreense]
MTASNAIAASQVQLSQEQLDWAKQIYGETAPDRAAAAQRAQQVSDAQLASMNTQTQIAQESNDYQKGTFRPLEQGIVADAQNYDTAARRDEKAAQAIADVSQQAGLAQASTNRDLARKGVVPGSGKSLALNNQLALGTATASAAASTKARDAVELQGYARKLDAANLGRGLSSSQATSAGLALTAGNSSSQNANAALGATTSGTGLVQQGYQGAQQGLSSAGNIYGQVANIENQANNNSGVMGALGQLGGAAIFKYSDKRMKHSIRKISGKKALKALSSAKPSTWKYKKGSPADDGGKTHAGPMAQDMQRALGDRVAPGGRMIDMVAESGVHHAAINELHKQVKGLASAVRRQSKAH